MSTKLCMLATLPALAVTLLGGSLHSPGSAPSPTSASHYRASSSPLPDSLLHQPNPGACLIDQAIEHAKKIKWLRTDVHIARHDGALPFATEGKLIRGDNHCVHMELSMTTRHSKDALRVKMVCDGFLLAEFRKFGARTAKISSMNLPGRETLDTSLYSPGREKVLANMGCAGPRPLLEEIREVLTESEVARGELHDRPVYRIAGAVDPQHPRLHAKREAGLSVDHCCVLLDAETLWPLRIEWRFGQTLVLESNYRSPQMHQPLTYDECVRYFTLKEE